MRIGIAQATLQSLVDQHVGDSYREAIQEVKAYIAEQQKPWRGTAISCAAQLARLFPCLESITDTQSYHEIHSGMTSVIDQLRRD